MEIMLEPAASFGDSKLLPLRKSACELPWGSSWTLAVAALSVEVVTFKFYWVYLVDTRENI